MAQSANLYPFTYDTDAAHIGERLTALGETLASLRRTLHTTLKLHAQYRTQRPVIAGLRRDIERAERYGRNGRQRLRQLQPQAEALADPGWRAAA